MDQQSINDQTAALEARNSELEDAIERKRRNGEPYGEELRQQVAVWNDLSRLEAQLSPPEAAPEGGASNG